MCPATATFLAPKKLGDKKEVACKFFGGWEKGTVHMQERSKANAGFFSIKVPSKSGWMLYDPEEGNLWDMRGHFAQDVIDCFGPLGRIKLERGSITFSCCPLCGTHRNLDPKIL